MVELRNVSAGYGKFNIIKDISLSFEKGMITSIIGKNGSGKTTLLKAASRQIKPNSGEVLIAGRNIFDYEGRELAKKVSYLPQVRNVPQINVQGLVLHGRYPYLSFPRNPSPRDREIADSAMKSVGIWNYRDKNLCELSGGERQKVYIAMVLCQDTDVIYLDEPTTFLDINHQLEIVNLVKKLRQLGKTIIMVIHDISAALCNSDRVCLMDEGSLVIYDNPKTVYESGEIERIFNVNCERLPSSSFKEGYLFDLKE